VVHGRENRPGVVTDLDESARVGDDSLRISLLAKHFKWILGNGVSTRRSPGPDGGPVSNPKNVERADRVVGAIQRFEGLEIAPVTTEAALTAARLREKYYQRGERELSYADAIHLAIAVMTDCDVLYSGDDDFAELDELETTIV
jgi:predicted nucleic acid-binding protein